LRPIKRAKFCGCNEEKGTGGAPPFYQEEKENRVFSSSKEGGGSAKDILQEKKLPLKTSQEGQQLQRDARLEKEKKYSSRLATRDTSGKKGPS